MIKIVKKILLLTLITTLVISNVSFASVNYTGEFNDMSDDATTVFLDKNDKGIEIKDLLVMGDSYSVFLTYYHQKRFNYIVHPGYNLTKIYNELVPLYPGGYKYVYLFIGGNDFMLQTDIRSFRNQLQMIIDVFKKGGAQVILSTYLDPEYDTSQSYYFARYVTPCSDYDAAVKKVVIENGLMYIDISDLYSLYGFAPGDFIHPSEEFVRKLKSRLYERISDDQARKAAPNYEKEYNIQLAIEFMQYKDEVQALNAKYFPEDYIAN